MRKSRFSEQQIFAILNEAKTGVKVKDLCVRHGISDATFYNWRTKYETSLPSEYNRLKEAEEQLAILKRMYAELALENHSLKQNKQNASKSSPNPPEIEY